MSVNTVMKHVTTLADKRLITVEHTSYIDRYGMKQNGNNCYTIPPIQQADSVVMDATTRHSHGDRKALTKEQAKKIAMGHKVVDHEGGQKMN